jgi:tetratricopeptide (TPR) repeat protein
MRSYLILQKYKSPLKLIFTAFILGFFFVSVLHAQTTSQLLQTARNLERAQYFEEALKIYERIYQGDQNNMAAIAGIKNCYVGLQKYQLLIDFLQGIIGRQPQNNNWEVDLAEALFLNDQRDRAFQIWNRLLAENPKDIMIYRLVGSAMIRQRQFNEAIHVYEQALTNIDGQFYLHMDIANLYRAQLDFENAAGHLLLYYLYQPKQLPFIQRQLLSLTDKSESMQPVIDAARRFLTAHPDQMAIQEMLAGFYIKDRNFALALQAYKKMENDQSAGLYLYKFASEALANQAYDYARQGFSLLISTYPHSPLRLQATYDLGRAYAGEANTIDGQDLSARRMQEAVNVFETIIRENKDAGFVGKSRIFLADIYFDYYFDLDKAISLYETYLKNNRAAKNRDLVLLRLGDACLTKNQAGQAVAAYRQVKGAGMSLQARFKIAEVSYYEKDFRTAQKMLAQILESAQPQDPLMNDILSRNFFLETFSNDSLRLAQYAEAELLSFQKKYTQAVETFESLARSKNPLQSAAGRQAAKLYMRLEKYAQAADLLNYLKTAIPEDKDTDEILYLQAETQEKLNDRESALQIYHELMLKYPSSLFLQEARERARKLSQLSTEEQT